MGGLFLWKSECRLPSALSPLVQKCLRGERHDRYNRYSLRPICVLFVALKGTTTQSLLDAHVSQFLCFTTSHIAHNRCAGERCSITHPETEDLSIMDEGMKKTHSRQGTLPNGIVLSVARASSRWKGPK
ncbi:uncharacterized protein SCHCODRAFT_02370622 [Schizophyllum commune H4-8]|uniref:uncharacterized protein n=1 Tax=Schizophyllum commune (strain H4-8 / FGSC 9210) TaxID=578458 RepID=UPI00215E4BB7|nr:uncharacterized protein SCHCODRAFT_02370622 [Schizophyllum commune H4-8]KAI5889558.1 hypothetical protein SCHCODRAFT_02370622 [Schizophyllum commune H4-8]